MSAYSDEQLTAFLDGEVSDAEAEAIAAALEQDPALAKRLAGLEVDFAPIREAFDAVLVDAPEVELPEPAPERRWVQPLMAASVALLVGVGVGWTLRAPEPAQAPGWLEVVAQYQALYAAETLAAVQPAPSAREAEVLRVAAAVGAPLTVENTEAAGLRYARGQVLDLGGRPLAQLLYQAADGTPVALCVIATAAGDAPVTTREVNGIPAAVWREGGFAYLVIGETDPATIGATAEAFA
ncbi:MAG: hypothetical protein AAGJ96_09980, partial [Pseudomonadota bacterium]